MKAVQINATCGNGSTGKICVAISKLLTENGIENYILFSSGTSVYPLGIKYTTDREIKFGTVESRVLGNWGFEGKAATKNLIAELDRIKPDVVHLHNLHSHACNLEMLFDWIKERKVKVFWTFHDCWAFTGYCTHFMMTYCDKWKVMCKKCPQKNIYSWFVDRSSDLYKRKI